jgi:hypothetical protein
MKHVREAQDIEGPLKWHGYSLPETDTPFVIFRRQSSLDVEGGLSNAVREER